jgi:hypothetical protein
MHIHAGKITLSCPHWQKIIIVGTSFPMKDSQELFAQIEAFEIKSKNQKAQSFREKLLQQAQSVNDEEFVFIVDKLINEKPPSMELKKSRRSKRIKSICMTRLRNVLDKIMVWQPWLKEN